MIQNTENNKIKIQINNVKIMAGVAQWIECQPVNQRVIGSIPSQGTCLDCRPGPQFGIHEKQPHIGVSIPFFLPLPPL